MNDDEKKSFDVPVEKNNYRSKKERRNKRITKLRKKFMKRKKEKSGLEQLREIREKTIERWSKSGLLEGLEGVKENVAQLFENEKQQIIKEDPSQVVDD